MYCLEVFENKYCIVLYAVVVDANSGVDINSGGRH